MPKNNTKNQALETKKDKTTVKFINEEELSKLLQTINTKSIYGIRLMAIITTMLSTGTRIHETVSLKYNQIIYNPIKEDGKKSATADIIGKGGKPRTIFFKHWCLTWIEKYLEIRQDNHPALFVIHCKKPYVPKAISTDEVRKVLSRACKKANIQKITPHMFRKTAATTMHYNGCDIRHIKLYLGHDNVTTTEDYLGPNYHMMQKVHDEYLNYGNTEKQYSPNNVSLGWAKESNYNKCRECGTTEKKHVGKGYCNTCYIRIWRKSKINKEK